MRDWRVRPETPADVTAIARVVAEAFARPEFPVPPEVALVGALRASSAWLPGLSMLAESDAREVVAYSLLTRVLVGDEQLPALALAPVGVLPPYQGQGAGTAVVRACLDAAAAGEERLVLVLGDPRYYGRFGFLPASRLGLRSRWSESGDHYQALALPSYADGPQPRGEVRYHRLWDAF